MSVGGEQTGTVQTKDTQKFWFDDTVLHLRSETYNKKKCRFHFHLKDHDDYFKFYLITGKKILNIILLKLIHRYLKKLNFKNLRIGIAIYA
jgi:hypothetical protein